MCQASWCLSHCFRFPTKLWSPSVSILRLSEPELAALAPPTNFNFRSFSQGPPEELDIPFSQRPARLPVGDATSWLIPIPAITCPFFGKRRGKYPGPSQSIPSWISRRRFCLSLFPACEVQTHFSISLSTTGDQVRPYGWKSEIGIRQPWSKPQ